MSIRQPDGLKMYAELERRCSGCQIVKPLDEFFRDKTQAGKKRSYKCKPCIRLYQREYKKNNPEKMKAKYFKDDLKKNYGMSVEEYKALYDAQNGFCACCGAHESKFKRRLNVDHDHATGKIRALICNQCNPAIGYCGESIERLQMMIDYLKKFKN